MYRLFAVLAATAVLAAGETSSAQTPYQIIPVVDSSRPLVYDPVSTPPAFDPETEYLVFEFLSAFMDDADIPFVVFPNGEVVAHENIEEFVARRLRPGSNVLFLCTHIPNTGTFNIYDPEHRKTCEERT